MTDRRLYPWNGHWVRNKDEEFRGQMMANYTRSKGDRMGIAGDLNDHADITTNVYDYCLTIMVYTICLVMYLNG